MNLLRPSVSTMWRVNFKDPWCRAAGHAGRDAAPAGGKGGPGDPEPGLRDPAVEREAFLKRPW